MAGAGAVGRADSGAFAARALAARAERLRREDPSAAVALGVVAEAKGVAISELLLPNRGVAEIAFARQLAMYLVHILLGRSLTEVGAVFGRDRTTVAHACALIEDMREKRRFDAEVDHLETLINERCGFAQMAEAHRAAS